MTARLLIACAGCRRQGKCNLLLASTQQLLDTTAAPDHFFRKAWAIQWHLVNIHFRHTTTIPGQSSPLLEQAALPVPARP